MDALRSGPPAIADVDAAWLTEVLRAGGTLAPGARVATVRSERIALETGFSSELYRVHCAGDPGTLASVIVKVPTTTAVRQAMDLVGGYAREVAFYREVAPLAPLRTPAVHHAEIGEATTDFLLVLEDLGAWENGDHFAGLPLARARAILSALAGLHAWSADPERGAGTSAAFPSLDSPVARQVFPALFAEGWSVYREHARRPIAAALADHADRFAERTAASLTALTERPMLIHGDIRADNVFFAPGDRLALVDFQLTARATGIVDVAYLVSQGLTREERAGQDRLLVREYLAALAAASAEAYGFDVAWRHYRHAAAFMLVFPVIAIRGWELLPERSRELCLRLIERAADTIEEIDALEVYA